MCGLFFCVRAKKKGAMTTEDGAEIVILQEHNILGFRKAIFAMKDVHPFILFCTSGKEFLQLSVVDHHTTGGMSVDIPVFGHSKQVKIALSSELLYRLATKLTNYKHTLKITLHHEKVVIFANLTTNETILPDTIFESYSTSYNNLSSIQMRDYYTFSFVSIDLLRIFVSLSIGTPIVRTQFFADGKIVFSNQHEMGQSQIEKQLTFSLDDVKKDQLLLDQMYNIKFVKCLVNPLVNSSQTKCIFGIPRSHTQPIFLRLFLTEDIYLFYLIFPCKDFLPHIRDIEHPQHSISLEHFEHL